MRERPLLMIFIGGFLVIAAWVLPFLMVLHIIPSTFLLDFLTYGAGVAGLFLGIIGAASYVQEKRAKSKSPDESGEVWQEEERK